MQRLVERQQRRNREQKRRRPRTIQVRDHTNQPRTDGNCYHIAARSFDERANDRCEQPDVLQDAEEDDREDEHHDDLHH